MSNILSKVKHKHVEAVEKWILQCLEGYSFIFGKFEDKNVTAIPSDGSGFTRYMRGLYKMPISYSIQALFSVGEDFAIWQESDIKNSENTIDYQEIQSVIEWIFEQEEKGNRPLVDGWQTLKVEPTSIIPNFDGVDDSGDVKLARYTLFVTVTYIGKMS